jgi:hypothetical protein
MPQEVEDDLLTHPMVARRRAQWRRLTDTWQPLNAEETAALVEWMRDEARRQKRWRYAMCALLSGIAAGFLAALIGHHLWNWNIAGYVGLINLVCVINLALMLAWNSEAHKEKLAALSNLTDVHLVGPLCEVAVSTNRDMRLLAQDALIRMLPRLQASDAARFTAEQRASLYGLLYANDFGLVRIVLKSLEQIGDGKALPYVQNLASGRYLAARDLRVRVIAEGCLPFLEERARQQQISETLLRPVSDGSADTLLRATAEAADTPPRQLLRAAQSPHEDV